MSIGAVTEDLIAARHGDRAARDRAFARVHAALERLAHAQLGRARPDTMSTTGLVHETHLALERADSLDVCDPRDGRKARAVLSTARGGRQR